jgi:hypothetical protein
MCERICTLAASTEAATKAPSAWPLPLATGRIEIVPLNNRRVIVCHDVDTTVLARVTPRNFLFLGSDKGGECAAVIYTLIESAKLNGLDPEAYLADVIDRMAGTGRSKTVKK